MSMLACPGCHRHLRVDEVSCPFCGHSIETAHAPVPSKLGAMALVVGLGLLGCTDSGDDEESDSSMNDTETTTGDGDGDTTGDGDGDTTGDGDGDTTTGDGDGDTTTGDGDGDTGTADYGGPPPMLEEDWF